MLCIKFIKKIIDLNAEKKYNNIVKMVNYVY